MVCFSENSKMSLFLSVSQHFSPHDFNSHSFAYYTSFKPKEWQENQRNDHQLKKPQIVKKILPVSKEIYREQYGEYAYWC